MNKKIDVSTKNLIKFIVALIIATFFVVCLSQKQVNTQSLSDPTLTDEQISYLMEFENVPINVAVVTGHTKDTIIFDILSEAYDLTFNFNYYDDVLEAKESVRIGENMVMNSVYYDEYVMDNFKLSGLTHVEEAIMFSKYNTNTDYINDNDFAVIENSIFTNFDKFYFDKSQLVPVKTPEEAKELINTGVVDAFISDVYSYEYMITNGFDEFKLNDQMSMLTVGSIGTKQSDIDSQILLDIIAMYSESYDFQYGMIREDYRIVEEANYRYLTELKESLQINKDKVYKIGINNFEPFAVYDTYTGMYSGIAVDTVVEIFDLLDLKFEIVNYANQYSWQELMTMFENGEIDVLTTVEVTDSLASKFAFANTLVSNSTFAVVKSNFKSIDANINIAELQHETFGVIENGRSEEILNNIFPGKEFKKYDNIEDYIKAVSSGEVDYIVIDEISYNNYMYETKDISTKKAMNIVGLSDTEFAIAFLDNKEGIELSQVFNSAFTLVKLNEKVKNYTVRADYRENILLQRELMSIGAIIVGMIILGLMIISFDLYRNLHIDESSRAYNRVKLNKMYKNGFKESDVTIYVDIINLPELIDLHGYQVGSIMLRKFITFIKKNRDLKIYRTEKYKFIIVFNYVSDDHTKKIVHTLEDVDVQVGDKKEFYHLDTNVVVLSKCSEFMSLDDRLTVLEIAMSSFGDSKDNVLIFGESDIQKYVEKMYFRKNLEQAISNRDIFAHFQPITDINTNKVQGVETLTRWRDKDQLVPVFKYLEEAKSLNMEDDIDLISLLNANELYEELVKNNLVWDNMFITVNSSEKFLQKISDAEFREKYVRIPKNVLKFEILEDVIIDNNSSANIKELVDYGYRIAVDDFGAGATSLKYIKNTEFDTVKIDRILLPEDPVDPKNSSVVKIFKSQVSILRELGKVIVVEGAETKEQVQFVKEQEITYVQGYYFAKPMAKNEIVEYIKMHRD